MIGTLYEGALAGCRSTEVEDGTGRRRPLPVHRWVALAPGDLGLLARCAGPTLDVGCGPGRLTRALVRRGVPALGIDVTPYAVARARATGAPALLRDVFGPVPRAGRWDTVLLADGNIGIGGDPVALLRRLAELRAPGGAVLVELDPPGSPTRREVVRLRRGARRGRWFPWARVGVDGVAGPAAAAGMRADGTWVEEGRWFARLR